MSALALRFVLLVFYLVALPAFAAGSAEPKEKLTDAELLMQLRQGGLNVYFRHVSTDFAQSDENTFDYEDCAKQRNLSDQGREEARRIGTAIRRLEIPVAEVLASPYCRTTETATLVFGKATKSTEVFDEGLAKLLATPTPPGSNRGLVSHGNPFLHVVGPPLLAEGEAAVVRPTGDGYTVIARIRIDEWERLLAAK